MLVLFPSIAILALFASSIAAGVGMRRADQAPRAQQAILALTLAAAAASMAAVFGMLRAQAGWLHWSWLSMVDPLLRPFGLGSWSDLAASPPAWARRSTPPTRAWWSSPAGAPAATAT